MMPTSASCSGGASAAKSGTAGAAEKASGTADAAAEDECDTEKQPVKKIGAGKIYSNLRLFSYISVRIE